MARVSFVPLDDLPEALRDAVARGQQSRILSSSRPVQVWAHRPNAALAWLGLLESLHQDSLLDERLRELVRLKIASITTCQACQLARKSDQVTEDDVACLSSDSDRFKPSERAALTFAELFASDYMAISDEHYARLAEFFSEAQVVELNMYCALMLAGGRMTYVQQAY
ncbi:carboxymuconolactone decarboxylase family protein [Stutzerimonas kunmingensis]|uniref:Carboxymuconolactone decarboxylase family protein n=1 Tax=Stutzerimonas kunmingensis TaxID=1211807 RepID=A0A9X1SRJ4_9GAMM|nr:carboxymuconolactone decarboxylase family protein [Stutzerimonas kunmingensis]MCD1606416.1 carboxymuconolactone decarboxylase family protein [Stutzerimonas kunmingensis]PKM28304.1 MAG: carboxymuconolactone decarboxylase [Gammaproteobacteria bacterium HGW-Gammaproteobacteria-11]PNG01267.1 carboxymuconolactone decarboxylase [Stutzerimonas kunmingensis]